MGPSTMVHPYTSQDYKGYVYYLVSDWLDLGDWEHLGHLLTVEVGEADGVSQSELKALLHAPPRVQERGCTVHSFFVGILRKELMSFLKLHL